MAQDFSYQSAIYHGQGGKSAHVGSGATLAVDSGGTLDTSAGTLTLGAGQVTAASLGANLKTGFIDLCVAGGFIIASNTIDTRANGAGSPASNTNPSLARINGATDKGLVLSWAASQVAEYQLAPVIIPPDLDATASVTFKIQAKMGGATDTPTLTIAAFEGIGDTTRGGATAALSSTLQTLTLALTLTAAPNFLSLSIVPGAHGTDAVNVYAAWLEYTRKT